jgi:hypothetical protein
MAAYAEIPWPPSVRLGAFAEGSAIETLFQVPVDSPSGLRNVRSAILFCDWVTFCSDRPDSRHRVTFVTENVIQSAFRGALRSGGTPRRSRANATPTTSPPTTTRGAARPHPQADPAYPAKTITPPDKSVAAIAPARRARWLPVRAIGWRSAPSALRARAKAAKIRMPPGMAMDPAVVQLSVCPT